MIQRSYSEYQLLVDAIALHITIQQTNDLLPFKYRKDLKTFINLFTANVDYVDQTYRECEEEMDKYFKESGGVLKGMKYEDIQKELREAEQGGQQ